jgi:hypothetical protein
MTKTKRSTTKTKAQRSTTKTKANRRITKASTSKTSATKRATPASAGNGLIVLGFDEQQKPCGARFVDAKPDLVAKAAQLMGLKVYKSSSPDVAEVAKKLPVGQLYANGRGFVPNIRQTLYSDVIVALSAEPQQAAIGPDDDKASTPVARGLPGSWDEIALCHPAGHHDHAGGGVLTTATRQAELARPRHHPQARAHDGRRCDSAPQKGAPPSGGGLGDGPARLERLFQKGAAPNGAASLPR